MTSLSIPLCDNGLILREFTRGDIPAVARIATTPGFSFYAFPPPSAGGPAIQQAAQAFVEKGIRLQTPDPTTGKRENYKLAVAFAKSPAKLIGYVALDEVSESRGELRDIGYFTDPEHQGRGIARAAASVLLQAFFKASAENTVWATVHPDNTGSCRVLSGLGFVHKDTATKIVQGVEEPRLVLLLERPSFAFQTLAARPAARPASRATVLQPAG